MVCFPTLTGQARVLHPETLSESVTRGRLSKKSQTTTTAKLHVILSQHPIGCFLVLTGQGLPRPEGVAQGGLTQFQTTTAVERS